MEHQRDAEAENLGSSIESDIAERVAAERLRLERQAYKPPRPHFRRSLERPLLAKERDKVTILFGGLTPRHELLVQAVFEGSGYRCEILPNPDRDAFQLGKENCNNAQCNPTYFTVGSLLQFLKQRAHEGLSREQIADNYVLFTAGSCGPCRFGMYEAEYRFALENAGFDAFRVLLFQQTQGAYQSGESGLKYTLDFGLGILNAINLSDVLSDVMYQIRPYEVSAGETDRVIGECMDHLASLLKDRETFELLEQRPWLARRLSDKPVLRRVLNGLGKAREHLYGKRYLDALEDCRERIGRIEVDRTRVKPIVKVTGEFWAQLTESDGNYHMFSFLEQEGAQVQVEPIAGWVMYLLYQAKANLRNRWGLDVPYERPRWWELGKRFKNKLPYWKKWSLLSVSERLYQHLYLRSADRLGGLAHELVPQDELARLAHPFYNSLSRGGEGHLEVGKNIYYTENKLCHMVLSLKPFGCMPSSQSDGIQFTVMNHYKDMVFLPIETSGEGDVHAHSRVQMALGDAKLKAREEFEQALEPTGKTLEQIQSFVADTPELRRAFYPIPRRPGNAGVAASFVQHVSDVMDGRQKLARVSEARP